MGPDVRVGLGAYVGLTVGTGPAIAPRLAAAAFVVPPGHRCAAVVGGFPLTVTVPVCALA